MPERYSNADIMGKLLTISMMQESMKADVTTVKEQALKTNGRVNTLEQWMNGIQAVEQYRREESAAKKPIASTRWFQNDKLVGGVVGLLLALSGFIGYLATQAGGMH